MTTPEGMLYNLIKGQIKIPLDHLHTCLLDAMEHQVAFQADHTCGQLDFRAVRQDVFLEGNRVGAHDHDLKAAGPHLDERGIVIFDQRADEDDL